MQEIDKEKFKSLMTQLARMKQEKDDVASVMNDTFKEAKEAGFDTKVMKQLLKILEMKKDEFQEQEQLLIEYRKILGI